MRRNLLLVAALAATFVVGTGSASADGIGLTLPPEVAEPPVDLATLVVYPADPLALGQTITEPAAVTDSELASVGVSSTTLTASSSAPDFVVDDDLAQCPDADFFTASGIQQAVTAAPPGSVIRVCPGLYTPVIVPKTLTLEAPVQHGQATQCQAALPPDPTKDAIVDAGNTPASGFTLAGDGIELVGFTVQNTRDNAGIFTSSLSSGYELRFNVVQNNTFGLYLNASGALETVVDHNCFRFNNVGFQVLAAAGNGIYSDQGLRNAVVQENTFVGNPSASMVFALNQQNLTISHNDGDNTIVLAGAQNALVEYNHLDLAFFSSGLFFGGAVTDTTARYNLIENASTGISSNTAFFPIPNELVIEKNHVRGSVMQGTAGGDGIRLTRTINSTVAGNKSERNDRDGIRLLTFSSNNDVHDNLSRDNGRDGMRVDADGSSGNTIEQNKMLGNVAHDCHDDTTGPGSGGTANFWIKNIGKTQNKPGLCKNAAVVPGP
jgi:parallel beta-helix repeat protein